MAKEKEPKIPNGNELVDVTRRDPDRNFDRPAVVADLNKNKSTTGWKS